MRRYSYRKLIRRFGLKEGIILFYLMEKERENTMIDGWFLLPVEEMRKDLGLKYGQQKNRIHLLLASNVISHGKTHGKKKTGRNRRGTPMIRTFRVNYEQIPKVQFLPGSVRSGNPCSVGIVEITKDDGKIETISASSLKKTFTSAS